LTIEPKINKIDINNENERKGEIYKNREKEANKKMEIREKKQIIDYINHKRSSHCPFSKINNAS
jgi:hypothetical protein